MRGQHTPRIDLPRLECPGGTTSAKEKEAIGWMHSSTKRWIVAGALAAACAATVYIEHIDTRLRDLDNPIPPPLVRLRRKLGVNTGAVILWPAAVLALLGEEPFQLPVSVTVCVVVAAYLSFEVTALSAYKGPLCEYENNDAVYERGVQVSTVAFAVATLLLSQRDGDLATLVAMPVFLALLFCTLSAVPSVVARRGVGATGHWSAFQQASVSFAAGLLCLSVARCVDELARRDGGPPKTAAAVAEALAGA
jgi:hypothetical protein